MKKEEVITYEVGDVVILKSGGPKMTVMGVCPGCNALLCAWFDDEGGLGMSEFPAACVVISEK